jgi:MFS family permease
LCTLLHAFTHAYGTLLIPLYLLMVADLRLAGVWQASLIVTVYGLVYCLVSYGAGVLADRVDRKALLGIGLMGNALAILLMGLTRQYELLIACGVMAGLFGSLFHPAANALVPSHFPKSPGMAIGVLGIGAGLGFFAGPQYAGWRAETAGWQMDQMADWQRPCVEMGIAGIVCGILFLLMATEARRRTTAVEGHPPLTGSMRNRVIAVAAVLGCRDFAGVAVISLGSVYLQKAHGLDARRTGFILGAMMLISIIVNPITVYFSPGRRRLPMLAFVLIAGGAVVAIVPLLPLEYVLPIMMIFMAFQLGSYAVSDAAVLERVSAAIRGRVVGLFLTIAGTFASLSPLVMGYWTDYLGVRAADPMAYLPIFGSLGALMIASAASAPLIARLGQADQSVVPAISEINPTTMEPAV